MTDYRGPLRRVDRVYRGQPTHHYTFGRVRADGVTTVLSKGLPKPALLPWGIKSVAEYAADHLDLLVQMQPMGRQAIVEALKQSPYTDRDLAARRGTEVHALAEQLVHGREVTVPDELAGHVESYVRFLDEWQPEPVLVEAVVGNRRWGYAGTLDLIARLRDGRLYVMDIKTTRSGIYGETALQLAAYRAAEFYLDGDEEKPLGSLGDLDTTGYGIWVRGDGYACIPLPIGDDTMRVFTHVLYLARQADRIKQWPGEPAGPPVPALPLQAAGDAA